MCIRGRGGRDVSGVTETQLNIRVAFNEKFKEWSKGYMPHARGWGGRGGRGGG